MEGRKHKKTPAGGQKPGSKKHKRKIKVKRKRHKDGMFSLVVLDFLKEPSSNF